MSAPVTLADLKPGQTGIVQEIIGDLNLKRRLSALGVVSGAKISLGHVAPMGDPRAYDIMDYTLSLRNREARQIVLRLAD